MVKIVVNDQEIDTEPFEGPPLDLMKSKTMKWISVKDEFPPDGHKVLYLGRMGKERVMQIMTGYREKDVWNHFCFFHVPVKLTEIDVTHWMSLPDYPRDE